MRDASVQTVMFPRFSNPRASSPAHHLCSMGVGYVAFAAHCHPGGARSLMLASCAVGVVGVRPRGGAGICL